MKEHKTYEFLRKPHVRVKTGSRVSAPNGSESCPNGPKIDVIHLKTVRYLFRIPHKTLKNNLNEYDPAGWYSAHLGYQIVSFYFNHVISQSFAIICFSVVNIVHLLFKLT